MYLELHTSSAFSFLEAASLPETLIAQAARYGYPAIALLDRDGVYGAPRFHRAATAAGIKAIIGAELTIEPTHRRTPRTPRTLRPLRTLTNLRVPVLVESAEGYRNLCRLITRMKMRAPKGEGALTLDELDGQTRGLIALAGRDLLGFQKYGVGGLIDPLVGVFGRGNVYVEIQRHLLRDEEADNRALVDVAGTFHVPIVATNGVRFADPAERPLFDVLTCIHHKTTLAQAGKKLARNAERYLKPPEEMARLFRDLPAALASTEALGERLDYTMADLGYRFPDYPVPPGETHSSFLRKLTDLGARERYRPYHDRARAQITRELDLIERLDLAGYFLIVWDIVNFCRHHDILVQGRGSAANSAVCYSLGITAVDPVGMDLLFERFLSEERGEWPDIDLDLPSGDRREQVIQHVYEKYGRLGAAMTANVITYRGKSAAREVGKTLGIDAVQVDRLAKVMNQFEFIDPSDTLRKRMVEVGCDLDHPTFRWFAELWNRMQDLPRHLGQHSGGMVICQGQLDSVVPLENASMPGRVVLQWDKDDCADMGLVKVDLLGLGMMAVLQDAITLVRPAPSISHIYRRTILRCTRCCRRPTPSASFRWNRARRWPRCRGCSPERFYDLVVEVAIIRPGPIVGNMVHPYLNRRAGREPVEYAHPSLEPILKRTLGVPLFQEQLLRMAMVTAGFTGGQAEDLRRALGFKRSEKRMKEVEVKLRAGMANNGITGDVAEQIISSITAFALYGFPESHAASFALLAYASAYLKAHFPAAFYTALLNNQPMGFYHPATLVKDAQRRGVRFTGVDVQHSDWLCRVDADGSIRLGLRYASGLREDVGRAIEKGRVGIVGGVGRVGKNTETEICPKCGCDDRSMLEVVRSGVYFCNNCAHDWSNPTIPTQPKLPMDTPPRFTSVDDLVTRTGIRRDELQTLADIGAFASFGYERREALWQVEKAVRPAGELFEDPILASAKSGERAEAYGEGGPNPKSLVGEQCPLPAMTAEERLVADYAGTHLTIGPHPMAMRRSELAMRGVLRAVDLSRARDGRRIRVAGSVITRQRPGTAKGFVFLTLEDETGIANIIIRPDLFDRERFKILDEPFLLIDGILQNQDGVTSVKAERLLALGGAAVEIDSHDFH